MRNSFLRRTTEEDTPTPDRRAITSTPRWVKVAVGIIILLVLGFIILHLTGNGMGAQMHMERGVYPL